MIHYLVTKDECRGISRYLASRGRALSGSFRILFFDDLRRLRNLPEGICIFSNLDHLSPAQRDVAGRFGHSLLRNGTKVLNRPHRVLLRRGLLHELHARGLNRFRAVGATDSLEALRYPVFLRAENNHLGALSGLLHSAREVDRAIREKMVLGYRRSELLLVEFCDTSDSAGVFRKYSAMKVGDRILPRYLNLSSHWIVKFEDCREEHAPEVLDYLERNPHEAMLREIFEIAGAEYGRIDYGMLDGRPQVWEINLNPLFGRRRPRFGARPSLGHGALRKLEEAKETFHTRFLEALRELDGPGSPEKKVALEIPRETLRALRTTARLRARTRFRAFMNMKRKPWVFLRKSLDAAASVASLLIRPFV